MSEKKIICPECNIEIERKYGLPALVYTCVKCNKEYVKCLGRLMPKKEFVEIRREW